MFLNSHVRAFFFLILFFFITLHSNSQVITGKIIDASTGEPLEYVNIGIVNTLIGSITDNQGQFKINVDGQSPNDSIRFSMISYKTQAFKIEELFGKENKIKLTPAPMQLSEVIVKPFGKIRKKGNTSYTHRGNWCGKGGSFFGKGCEIGLKVELGSSPVQLASFHIHMHRQAFDSSLYRLHIRNIVNNFPSSELLTDNIFLTMSKESGWAEFDLSKYNIVLKGDVVISVEWIKVFGVNKNRTMKINKKMVEEYVLFNTKKNKGILFSRWSAESKWNISEKGGPAMYLTIKE